MSRTKIALLAPASNVHTHKWLDFYDSRGFDVLAITLAAHADPQRRTWPHVRTAYLPLAFGHKAAYLLTVRRLRRMLREDAPDLVHAHFLSSYGLLAALAGRHPLVVSAWGTDVYEFPRQGPLQRRTVEYALRRADAICSTSHAMKRELAHYTPKPVAVTPFGVDTTAFAPRPRPADGTVVFGLVKTMQPRYGIDTLLRGYRAFADLVSPEQFAATRLVLVGGGPNLEQYRALARTLGLGERVEFTGQILHADVPAAINGFDVQFVPSDAESFGVAAVEAMASGVPVVVSDVGGLPEVVLHGVTGYVVPARDPAAIAERMRELAADPATRVRLGAAGRAHAVADYEWEHTAELMLDVYAQLG